MVSVGTRQKCPLDGGVAVATPPQNGDIDQEPQRRGSIDDHDGSQTRGTDAGAGGGADGGGLAPEQAHLAREGVVVQLDGSHHDWFEGRRAKCVLMVIVRTLRNGQVQLVYRGKALKWRSLPEGTKRKHTPFDRRGWRCGTPVGLRHAPASLCPASPAGKPKDQQRPTKGTFSRELTRGLF